MTDFISEIRERRVLPAVGVYAAGCWVLIEILDRLVERYLLSPYITDAAFWGLYSMIPAVVLVAWSHGKPGKDRATAAEKVGVPMNLIATAGLLFTLFGGKDLGAAANAVTVANEEGVRETHYIPAESFRRRMAVFFFDNESGRPELDWLQYGITELLVQDLQQNPFVLASSPWANFGNGFYARRRAAGFEDGLDAPRSLMREIAVDANRQYFVEGSLDEVSGEYRITVRIWDAETLQQVAELKRSGFDLYRTVDQLSVDLFEALDVPTGGGRILEDLPLAETFGESEQALRAFVAGLNERLFTNDVQASNAHFDDALEADPGFVMAWFTKAMNLIEAGDLPAAQAALAKAQELDYRLPSRDRAMIKQLSYRLSGQQDKLLAFLRLQVQLRDDASSYSTLAFLLMAMGELEDAKRQYESALERDALNLGIHLQLASLERATGHPEAAIAHARTYLEEKPEDASGHLVLGDLLRDRGELDSAREHYLQASLLANEPVDAFLRLADVAARRGDEAGARNLIGQADASTRIPLALGLVRQAAARLESRYGRLRASIDQLYAQEEYLSQSVAPYQVALATYIPIASSYLELGELDQARAAVAKAESLIQPPLDRFMSFVSATILAREGRFEEAEEQLAQAAALVEEFRLEDLRSQVDLVEGLIRFHEGDYPAAAAAYRSARDRTARSVIAGNDASLVLPELDAYTADALIRVGDLEAAANAIDRGFELDPSYPRLWLMRARHQQAMGARALALASVNYALAIWKDADPEFRLYREARELARELTNPI